MLSNYLKKRLKNILYYYPHNLNSRIEEFKGNKIMHISIADCLENIQTIGDLNNMIGKILSKKFLIVYYNHLTGKEGFSRDIGNRIEYAVYQIFKSDGMKGVDKILKDMIEFHKKTDFVKEILYIDNLRFNHNPKGFNNNT